MKNIYFFIAFIFIISSIHGQEKDSLDIIEIPESYANRLGKPLLVKKDSLYVFRTPHVYLVNRKSYEALRDFYKAVGKKNDMTNALLENYTATLQRNIELEVELKANLDKNDSLDTAIYQKTETTLTNTQKALDHTIINLEKATNSLDLIEKSVKKQQRKSIFEKILIGIGGVGVGVLVGASL